MNLNYKKAHYVDYIEALTTCKMSKYRVISGPYFSVFGPEIIPFLDTFHAVTFSNSFSVYAIIVKIYVSCLEFI